MGRIPNRIAEILQAVLRHQQEMLVAFMPYICVIFTNVTKGCVKPGWRWIILSQDQKVAGYFW
jgi:hypothetical protein